MTPTNIVTISVNNNVNLYHKAGIFALEIWKGYE